MNRQARLRQPKRLRVPSDAQAKMLAWAWSGYARPLMVAVSEGAYVDATTTVCVKRGWIVPTNEEGGEYPNGDTFKFFAVSDAGLDAIEDYLRERRFKS